MSIPINQLVWMAGILDLKGRIIRKKNPKRASPQIVLAVETKEFFVVRGLANLTGTRPEIQEARKTPEWMRRGCADHCPEAHIHVGNNIYGEPHLPAIGRWTLTGMGVAVVLHNVLPFMMSDRGLTEVMAEILTTRTIDTPHGAEAVIRQLDRLHEVGWDFPENLQQDYRDYKNKRLAITAG